MAAEGRHSTGGPGQTGLAPRILLIEDNPGDARLVRELLAEANPGFELHWVQQLAAGLAYLAEGDQIAAVLLDLSLPDSQGLATFERLHAAALEVPIIMLTGLADEELALQALRGGAADYLTKDDISGALLVRAVRYAVERRQSNEVLRLSEEKLRLAMEASESGILDLDVPTRQMTSSADCQAMLGQPSVEVSGPLEEIWAAYIHPEDRAASLQALEETIAGRSPYFEREHRLRTTRGGWAWVYDKGKVVERNAQGAALRLLSTCTNITTRKKAEEDAVTTATLLAEQRRIATTLQESFKHPLPDVAGIELGVVSQTAYEPELIGGDFSEVFELPDGRIVVLIGDVAGKGIKAAGLTETVRSMVRAFSAIDPSPAFVLAKTNEVLLRYDPEEPHVTAFLAVLDPQSGHLSYASAGHPAPLHLSPFSCRPLGVGFGSPLHSFPGPYQEEHLRLSLDDYLLLYTDGVTEARRGEEEFGEERLIEVARRLRGASAQEVAEGVRAAALEFAGSLRDDLQVVCLRLA